MGNPSFSSIPDNILVPGFYVEFSTLDDEIALDDIEPAFMFVPMSADGTATPNTPVRVVTADHGQGLTGRGSIGDRMIKAFRANNLLKELWIVPVADAGGGVKPVWTFHVPATPTGDGSIFLYIGGQRVQVPVSSTNTHQEVAQAIVDAIEDAPDLVVEYVAASINVTTGVSFTTTTASDLFNDVAHGLVAGQRIRFIEGTGTLPVGITENKDYWVKSAGLTADAFAVSDDPVDGPAGTGALETFGADAVGAVTYEVAPSFQVRGKNAGTLLNDLDIQLNYKDSASGEILPEGLTVEWTQTTAGSTDPTLTTPVDALGDDPYDYIATPWASILDDLDEEMTLRWRWDKLIYGHVWHVKNDTSTNLLTYGDTRNSKNETVFGVDGYPTPAFEILGAIMGQMSLTLDDDPALPEQTLVLEGVLPPKRGDAGRWDMATRNALLTAGIATLKPERGNRVSIERSRNTYKTDADDNTDKTFRDIQSRFIPMRSTRYLGRVVQTKFKRKKIVSDDNVLPVDGSTVSPKVIKNEFLAAYIDLMEVGWLTNVGLFKERASVVQDSNDPSRINVLFPNEIVKQVRLIALQNALK